MQIQIPSVSACWGGDGIVELGDNRPTRTVGRTRAKRALGRDCLGFSAVLSQTVLAHFQNWLGSFLKHLNLYSVNQCVSYWTLTTPLSLLRCAVVVLKRAGRIEPLGQQASTIHCGWKTRGGGLRFTLVLVDGLVLDAGWWDLQFGWRGWPHCCNLVHFSEI